MRKLAGLIALITVVPALGQESTMGNWLIYFGNTQFNKTWNWHHEAQYRNYNAIGDLEQLLLRTGIGMNLTENNNNVLLGYGFIHTENYLPGDAGKLGVSEHRLFQQFITRQRFGPVYLQHRYRVEQRFVAENFRLRLRYFLGVNIPLGHPEMADQIFYLSGYNEVFLHTAGGIFDRNRLYGGIGYRMNSHLRFELGYMNQTLTDTGRSQFNLVSFVSF